MIKFILFLSILLNCIYSFAINKNDFLKQSATTYTSGITTALAKADIVLCKSMINLNHLKGESTEIITGKFYLEYCLKKEGSWQSISAKLGPQGIDQIYIKYEKGIPKKIIVGEVKYGTSRLDMTKDGIQLGEPWTQVRLNKMSENYLSISKTQNIKTVKRISKLQMKNEIVIRLKNGEKVVFWRENSTDKWKFDGRKQDLNEAMKQVERTGKYLGDCGAGKCSIRRRLYEVKSNNGILKIVMKDASGLDQGLSQSQLKETGQLKIPLSGKTDKILTSEIAKQLKKKFPHMSNQETKMYAKEIVEENSRVEEMKTAKYEYRKQIVMNSFKAGVVGGIIATTIELTGQLYNQGKIDLDKLAYTGGVSFIATSSGVLSGQIATGFMLENAITHNAIKKVAISLGLTRRFVSSVVGVNIGGGITTLIFSYGGYLAGYYDAYTANKMAVSGVVGLGAGSLATMGVMSLATMYGTAGTGVAISSLSGCAANSAAMAWLGGSWVGGPFGVIAVGTTLTVTSVVTYGWSLYDDYENNAFLLLMINKYVNNGALEIQAIKKYPNY